MSKKSKKKTSITISVTAALILVIAAIILDSRFRLVTTEYELLCRDLPSAFDGYRVVQLSDLHGAEFGESNIRLLKKVEEATPDIIALTGDFISAAADVEHLRPFLKELVKLAPVYFVSGNHDWASGSIDKLAALLDELGIVYLRNDYVTLSRGGESIILAGVEDPNGWAGMPKPDRVADTIRAEYPNSFVLLLAHRNYWVERYPDLDVDLILCGHGHGGIVRLPVLGGLIGTNFNLLPEFDSGLYSGTHYEMLVSRGLGNSILIPRFLNNGEIVVAVLRCE
ncbi:MAG TPA: metallophosphoesterase [Clostridiales bacterium]|nr:metallophosphoesterase [Clostridiales bacterium]